MITKISVINDNGSCRVLASEQRLSTRLKREKLSILQSESNRFRKMVQVLFTWNTRGIKFRPKPLHVYPFCYYSSLTSPLRHLLDSVLLLNIVSYNLKVNTNDSSAIQYVVMFTNHSSLVGANVGSRYYIYNKIHVS